MICLIGESASGKSTIQDILCSDEYGLFKKLVTYTTRPPRPNEEYGVHYYFVTEKDFIEKEESGFFAESASYRDWHYGTAKKDCTDDKVAVVTPHGFRQLKKNKDLSITSFYIKVPRKDRLMKNLERGDNIEEAYRRNLSDVGMFDGIEDEVDFVIENPHYEITPEFMAKKVFFMYKSLFNQEPIDKKLTIFCDIDGVVNDLIEKLLEKYNIKYNDNITKDDITEYRIQPFLKEECSNIFVEFMTDNLIERTSVLDGAVDVITKLMERHNFYFLSATYPQNIKSKNDWLKANFPLYKESMLITCSNKKLLHGDILIDDCIDNLNSNIKLNILFDQPWNRQLSKHPRAFTWEEVSHLISHFYGDLND